MENSSSSCWNLIGLVCTWNSVGLAPTLQVPPLCLGLGRSLPQEVEHLAEAVPKWTRNVAPNFTTADHNNYWSLVGFQIVMATCWQRKVICFGTWWLLSYPRTYRAPAVANAIASWGLKGNVSIGMNGRSATFRTQHESASWWPWGMLRLFKNLSKNGVHHHSIRPFFFQYKENDDQPLGSGGTQFPEKIRKLA